MRIIAIIATSLVLTSSISSQGISDIVRYSLYDYGSTARSIGVGSSISPLGADLSVASTNPAGLGGFYKSEFAFTMGVPINMTEATLNQAPEKDNKTTVRLQNLGAVFTSRPRSTLVRTLNIAVGINTLASFDQDVFYSGNSNGTRVERFLERALDQSLGELSDFEEGLAYDTELIVDRDSNQVYESDFVTLDEELYREEQITQSGSLQELYLAVGSNIGSRLSLGATLGIPILTYSRSNAYLESDDLEGVVNFQDYIFRQDVQSDGGGVNLKLGMIYKPLSKLRLSVAVHSPTWLFVTDEYSSSLDFRLDGEENGVLAESPVGNSEYIMRTPWRAMAGAGVIYAAGELKGFISADVEYVDYSSANFSLSEGADQGFNPVFARTLNGQINNELTSAINVRLGTEVAYDHWRLRAGLGLIERPYKDQSSLSIDPTYSAGLGYRANSYYVDLSYRGSSTDSRRLLYNLQNDSAEQSVGINSQTHQLSLTVGFKI